MAQITYLQELQHVPSGRRNADTLQSCSPPRALRLNKHRISEFSRCEFEQCLHSGIMKWEKPLPRGGHLYFS